MDIYVRQYVYPESSDYAGMKVFKFFRKLDTKIGARYELYPQFMSYGFASKARAERRAREVEAEETAKEEAARALEEAAWNAYQAEQAIEPVDEYPNETERIEAHTWEWEERRLAQEGRAYCGFEEF